jgi:membrane-bound serine protease (ClpP class)
MTDPAVARQLFVLLIALGIIFFCIEIFVPGGVLGFIAGLLLLGGIIMGFSAFPGYGGYIAVGVLVFLVLAVVLWVRVFLRTGVGRKMTVSQSLAGASAADDNMNQLLGKEGTTLTTLRPGGFALIDGRKVDVVTEGEMLPKDTKIRVIRVEGNRVVVTKIA